MLMLSGEMREEKRGRNGASSIHRLEREFRPTFLSRGRILLQEILHALVKELLAGFLALLLQEEAQVGAVAVDGVGDHPVDGEAGRLGTLDHQPGQFGLGLKGDGLGDVRSEPTRRIGAPLFGQVQLAVDERVAPGRDVGNYVE
jgi:hypothetical protein